MGHELGSVASLVVQRLGKLLIEEFNFLSGVSAEVKQMEIELNRMQCFLEVAEARRVQEDRIGDRIGDRILRNWVAEVRELSLDAEDVIATFLVKVAFRRRSGICRVLQRYFCIISESKARHKVGLEILDINKKIADLTRSTQTYGNLFAITSGESSNPRSERQSIDIRQSFLSDDLEDPVGLAEDVKTVVDQLVKRDCKVVAIWGMGGLPKTTLAKMVCAHSEVKSHFQHFAWAYISQQCKTREVLEGICMKLRPQKLEGDELSKERKRISELDIDALYTELHDVQSEKKCLVILDDIWESNAWDGLHRAFPKISESGSKILITTRNRNVALHVDPQCFPHELKLLTDEESLKLFLKKALPRTKGVKIVTPMLQERVDLHANVQNVNGASKLNETPQHEVGVDDQISEVVQHPVVQEEGDQVNLNVDSLSESMLLDEQMMKLGKNMVKDCGGLPLAIVVLGRLLATKPTTLEEWHKVRTNLETNLKKGKDQGGVALTSILDLSFNDLPYHLKACFLCLSDLPEDEGIRPIKLTQKWMAEGFVPLPVPTRVGEPLERTMLDVGLSYLEELYQRSMILAGSLTKFSRRVKFYRLHDLMRDFCLLKAREENFIKVVLMGKDSATASLLSSSSTTIRRLGVYCLGGSKRKGHVKPFRIHENWNLQHVRSCQFYFFGNKLEDFDWRNMKSIFKGFKLLTFMDLEKAKFTGKHKTLPKSIGNLIHLRYLSIRDSKICGLPSSIGNLRLLETLDLRVGFGVELVIPNVLWKLVQLSHLYLPDDINNCHGPIEFKLQLDGLSRLETLQGFNTKTCDVSSISKLTNLRKLDIEVRSKKHLAVILESLNLRDSDRLLRCSSFRIRRFSDSWRTPEEENHSVRQILGYHHLQKLSITTSLTELPDIIPSKLTHLQLGHTGPKVGQMPKLEEFPTLKKLILLNGKWKELVCLAGAFPQLMHLELFWCNELEEWRVEQGAMPNLSYLKIWGCEKLKEIPDGLRFVKTLSEFRFGGSTRLKDRLQKGGEDFDKIQHVQSITIW